MWTERQGNQCWHYESVFSGGVWGKPLEERILSQEVKAEILELFWKLKNEEI